MDPGQAAVTPAGQALKRADPEGAVTCAEQTVDARDRRLRASRRLPPYEPDAVEVKESELAPEPQVAVGCWAIAKTAPSENPSRTVHAVCAYWLTAGDGSNARRGADANKSENAALTRNPVADLMCMIVQPREGKERRVPLEP
jgi:hypothetical protein